MCLLGEFERSLHVVEILLVFLDAIFLILLALFTGLFRRLNLLEQVFVSSEQFLSIDLTDLTERNVRNLVFETSMDKDAVVACPAGVSETLNRVEFVPFT